MARALTRWTVEGYDRMIENGLLAGRVVQFSTSKVIPLALAIVKIESIGFCINAIAVKLTANQIFQAGEV